MSNNPKVWMLEIASFVGTGAIGAHHTYGVLQGPGKTVPHATMEGAHYEVKGPKWQVNQIMTKAQAKSLNDLNEVYGRSWATENRAGDASHQYDSKEEVKKHGLVCWEHLRSLGEVAEGAVLLSGTGYGSIGPCKPLAGPQDVVDALREIWLLDESETSYDWTSIRKEASRRWDQALRDFGLDEIRIGGRIMYDRDKPKAPDDDSLFVTTLDDGTLRVSDERPREWWEDEPVALVTSGEEG